ncbi:MAG: GAF domain-containing sensor histidine kinase [bacterium]|nr:GAF domain-containing sensor histidine kinase [bacterium]
MERESVDNGVDNDLKSRVQHLEQKVTMLTRLLEVTTVLNSALLNANLRLDSLLSYLMDAAAEITESEGASVLLWNNNTRELFFAATTSDSPVAKSLLGKPVPLDSIAGTILRERRTVQVENVTSDPRHYNKLDNEVEFVTRSLLGVPMVVKQRVIGVLEVVNKKQLPWTDADKTNLSLLAEEAAVAIEVAQLVVALQKANTELSELDKLKSDFIAIASHELRTPLGVIMGYASFLQEETDASVSAHAGKVMESALKLRRIIEDMINLRYLKQSPSELTREVVPLGELISDLERDILTLTDASQHTLKVVTLHPDAPLNIDRGRFGMALINILNNAVAFTPLGGTIQVEARMQNDEAWITITDSGIGLEKDQFERIFEEFYQVEDHMTRKHGGLGIGLSITKALVKAHGGRVWASSPGLGKGSTFTVTLPLHK